METVDIWIDAKRHILILRQAPTKDNKFKTISQNDFNRRLFYHIKISSNLIFQFDLYYLGTYLYIWLSKPIENFDWSSLIFFKYPLLCYKIHLFLWGSRIGSTYPNVSKVADPEKSINIPKSMTVFVKPRRPPYDGKSLWSITTVPNPHTTPIATFLTI